MPKNTNKTKKTGTNLDLTSDSLIEKYWTISIKFKIRISQLIAKILLKQRSLNQIRHCLTGHIQSWYHLLFGNKKYFNDFQNRNFWVLWLNWIQTMEKKQNQTFFHGAYSNLTSYTFLLKNIKVLQWFSKSKFLSFITEVNPNNENETKSGIFFMGHIQIWYYFWLVPKC